MDKVTALKRYANDSRLSQEERDAAREALRILAASDTADRNAAALALRELGAPATPQSKPAATPADAKQELHLLIYGPELKALLDFAGVARLSDLTVDPMRRYADAQPKPLSKSTLRALSCCSARSLWPQIKAAFPESEWRAEFTKIAVETPYLVQDLAHRNNEDRRRFQFRATMCEYQTAYAVRVYLIQHVHEILNGLMEYQFELRDEIQAFINNQEKRWKPEEPWMWQDHNNVSRPGPKSALSRA